jgi:hypothetical protein
LSNRKLDPLDFKDLPTFSTTKKLLDAVFGIFRIRILEYDTTAFSPTFLQAVFVSFLTCSFFHGFLNWRLGCFVSHHAGAHLAQLFCTFATIRSRPSVDSCSTSYLPVVLDQVT